MPETRSKIDISENTLREKGRVLDLLLTDMTLKSDRHKLKNTHIIWATDSYVKYGKGYRPQDQIKRETITGEYSLLIQPRAVKSKEEQLLRTKDKAEVFTPLKIVSEMNGLLGRNLGLPDGHDWRDYVNTKWLEITCGEAPFIASRYNPTSSTGTIIKLENRVGFLDRKLQLIGRKCNTRDDWLEWSEIAYKSCYGYEWQGDNLLLARENLLYTFIDYYKDKFHEEPSLDILEHFAEIVAWNIFQMDGTRYVIPMTCSEIGIKKIAADPPLLKLLGLPKDTSNYKVCRPKYCRGCRDNDPFAHDGKKVKIMDWETGKPILFNSLVKL